MLYLLSYQVLLLLLTIATAKILYFPIRPTKILQKFLNQDAFALTESRLDGFAEAGGVAVGAQAVDH